jgi:ABC-type spermidine/putrescine transport system permease subunit II
MMAVVLLVLGYFLIWPVLLLLINSFNAAGDWFVEPRRWGVDHWVNAPVSSALSATRFFSGR